MWNFSSSVQLDISRVSAATMYYFVYYINMLIKTFLTIFRTSPSTFRRLPKILLKLSVGHMKVSGHFTKKSENNQRFSEDNRRFQTTFEERSKTFRSYTKKVSDKHDISEGINILSPLKFRMWFCLNFSSKSIPIVYSFESGMACQGELQ